VAEVKFVSTEEYALVAKNAAEAESVSTKEYALNVENVAEAKAEADFANTEECVVFALGVARKVLIRNISGKLREENCLSN